MPCVCIYFLPVSAACFLLMHPSSSQPQSIYERQCILISASQAANAVIVLEE